LLTLALLALPGAGPAWGEDPTPQQTPPLAAAPPGLLGAPALHSGLLAFLDPETGEVRQPTAEEAAALRRVLLGTTEQLALDRSPLELALPSGGFAALVDPALHDVSVVRREADGSLSHHCVPGEAAARRLTAAPPVAGQEE
jgi:hypothetical protein